MCSLYLARDCNPLADHDARVALERSNPDRKRTGEGFVAGGNPPDDVDRMINLFSRYHSEPYIQARDRGLDGGRRVSAAAPQSLARNVRNALLRAETQIEAADASASENCA